MSFLYPLGLIGLIGIPILIVIYIIKSKYTEQTVSSTYLWTLSEKFLKRKNRVSRLAGIISLILQLLAVTAISLLIAHPIIILPDSANEYCFVLDGSGSMHIEEEGKTRFEIGKERIAELIDSATEGSVYTLVYVGDTTGAVFEQLEDKEQAKLLLSETKPVYRSADFTDALGVAQSYFDENPSLKTYLVTDIAYAECESIEIINVAGAAENCSVYDVTYTRAGDRVTVVGSLISHTVDRAVTLGLYFNGSENAAANESYSLTAGNAVQFTLTADTDLFSSLKVRIAEPDALAYDNEYIIHDVKSESSYNTLIVSERPFFIVASLENLISAKIDVLSPEEYDSQSGYGLYIFDSFTPESLPRDGAIWLINAEGSVDGSGYSVQGEVALSGSGVLEPSSSSSSSVKALMKNLSGDEIHVTKYIKCAYYRNFTTLYSYKGNPVIFAGANANGNRQVTIAFDLHDSNFLLLYDYMALINNLVTYSFPEMIDKTSYECTEEAEINVVANCDSIRVESPLGNVSYLNTDNASATLPLTEVGVYTVTMTVAGSPREFYIYSAMTEAEMSPLVTEENIGLQGEPSLGGFDGKYDTLMALFIILALLFTADWVVYCYEKYQLR